MGCSDITAFVGETRDAEGGRVRLDVIGAAADQAIISVTTPWGATDNYETIRLNRSLSFTKDTKKYTVTLESVVYSSYRGEYFCKFEVCETTVTPPATPTPAPTPTPTPTPTPRPIVVVCRKGCISGTFTYSTGRRIDGKCELIPNSPECGYLGFIKCQAYDSTSNKALYATVRVDGQTIAPKTPCTTQGLAPGSHTVTFIHAGYITKTVTVTVTSGQTINAYGSMVKVTTPTPAPTPTPTPIPSKTGKIHCTTSPSGATIQIKDMSLAVPFFLNYGVTNKYYIELKAGTHVVKYTKAGYKDYETTISVVADRTMYVTATLRPLVTPTPTPAPTPSPTPTPVPTLGSIKCQAYDSVTNSAINASIKINGLAISQKAPYTIPNLTPASHRIEFIHAGYVTKVVTVTVKAGQTVNAYGSMTKITTPTPTPVPATGYIRCQAYDSVTNAGLNATLRIDGTTIVPKTPHTTPALPIGTHKVTFIHEGYTTKDVTVTVRAGQTANAYGSMVKKLVTGIVCSSVPTTASIYLDGANTLQYTPHTLDGVSAGVHTITYYKSGYEPTSRVVNAVTGVDVSAYAPMFPSSTNTVKMRVYIQSGVSGVTEDTFHDFIKKVSDFYKSKGIDVNFIVHELIWINTPEPSNINLSGVDVVLMAGEGVGHFIGTIQRVGANLLNPFKFTQQGVVALAHEFGHYFGVIDQYWLNMPQTTTPVISSDIKSSIMYDSYTLTNGFSSFEKKIILSNLSKLQQGNKASILYPVERWSKELSIDTGKSNVQCSIFASNRDYSTFNSSFPSTPTLIKSTDQNGILTFNMQSVSNRVEFDVYHIKCGTQSIWVNSTILDLNYIESGIVNTCHTKYVSNTQWCILAPPPAPVGLGFDIKVNIPGLLPKSSLHIQQVVKIPFTDTWWNAPLGHGMRWDNISNGVFKARGRSADSSPTPAFHTGFDENEDYVIYVGTSAVAFYPGSIIHRSTGKVTEIDLTSSYIDWVSSKVCSTFGITPANCPFFIATSVNDAAFLLELWSIITKHENLAGEHTLPTALDYALIPVAIFGLFSPGISEGAIASMIGKRFGKLIELSKKGTIDVKELAQDPRLSTFILRATESQFGDLILHLEEGNLKTAKILLGAVENITPTNTELNALDRAVKLTKKTGDELVNSNSVEELPTVLSKFSVKFAEVYNNAVKWATAHPTESVMIGIGVPAVTAIAYIMSTSSINYDSLVETKGIKAGDTSWTAKDYIGVIDTYMFNVKDAERAQNWDAFCENLALWKAEVDKLKVFLLANGTTLRAEGTYDVLESSILAYYKAIELKEEVHTCVEEPLPEVITAEVIDIMDGDTVLIRYDNKEYEVRLLGINTPESKTYDYTCTGVRSPYLIRRLLTPGKECIDEETWTGTEELYNASKVWLGQNLPVHQTARFYSDPTRQFDKYGRLLASPYYNGKYVCVESLRAGMAVVFFYDYNKQVRSAEFLAAETEAKDAKIGVWVVEAGVGAIRCISTPTAAEVWLDGVYTGKKTISSIAWLYNIPVGEHTVEFKKIIDNVSHACKRFVTVNKDRTVEAMCTLVSGITPTPTPTPPITPTPIPTPEKAIWQIGDVKNEVGAVLGAAKVFVDDVYLAHYAPETITFCTDCVCDTVVPCGFGTHTVTIKKTGYEDWSKTRTLGPGDSFTDNPIMSPPAPGTFPVTFVSKPSGATIKVDGKAI